MYNNRFIAHSIDCKLTALEKKHGITMRWQLGDKEYLDVKNDFLKGIKGQVRTCLKTSVVKQFYLLQMKAKYAGKYSHFYICYIIHYTIQMGKKLPKNCLMVFLKK